MESNEHASSLTLNHVCCYLNWVFLKATGEFTKLKTACEAPHRGMPDTRFFSCYQIMKAEEKKQKDGIPQLLIQGSPRELLPTHVLCEATPSPRVQIWTLHC